MAAEPPGLGSCQAALLLRQHPNHRRPRSSHSLRRRLRPLLGGMHECDMTRLQAEFEKFDRNNPHVWKYFVRFAFQAISRGHRHLSTKLIIERIRWEIYMSTTSDDDFKINNNHAPYYARKWIRRYPDYATFFAIRRVAADYDEFLSS